MRKGLTIFSCVLLLHACHPLENIEPLDDLALEEVFQTGDDLETALIGVYSLLQTVELAENNLIYLPDLAGANVSAPTTVSALTEIGTLNLSVYNTYAEQIWQQAYRAINQCNQILAVIDEVLETDAQLSSDEARRIKGETYFLRAVLYFELIRYYAKPYSPNADDPLGVPLVTEPVIDKEDIRAPARNSVHEVYTQILQDLNTGQELMPPLNTRGRSNAYAAAAYLAKVFFQMTDYEKAAEWSQLILEEGDFSLSSSPADNYTKAGSVEEIWSVVSLPDDHDINTRTFFFSVSAISDDLWHEGYERIITQQQSNTLEASQKKVIDLRWQRSPFLPAQALVSEDRFSLKYEDPNQADDSPMVRLAEIYLILAESLVRTEGINTISIDLLNQVRYRAIRVMDEIDEVPPDCQTIVGFTAADFSSTEDLLQQIFLERRVELAFEGNYFHDLMRLRKSVQGFSPESGNLQFPIPQSEIDVNPNLVQNPFYE